MKTFEEYIKDGTIKKVSKDIHSKKELKYKGRDYVRFAAILFFFIWLVSMVIIIVKFIFSLVIPAPVVPPQVTKPPFNWW